MMTDAVFSMWMAVSTCVLDHDSGRVQVAFFEVGGSFSLEDLVGRASLRR